MTTKGKAKEAFAFVHKSAYRELREEAQKSEPNLTFVSKCDEMLDTYASPKNYIDWNEYIKFCLLAGQYWEPPLPTFPTGHREMPSVKTDRSNTGRTTAEPCTALPRRGMTNVRDAIECAKRYGKTAGSSEIISRRSVKAGRTKGDIRISSTAAGSGPFRHLRAFSSFSPVRMLRAGTGAVARRHMPAQVPAPYM